MLNEGAGRRTLIPYSGQVVAPRIVPRPNPWTDELVAEAIRLNADGFSASQIAAELGHNLSRNAVIGKLHRKGLTVGRQQRRTKAKVPQSQAVNRARRRASFGSIVPQRVFVGPVLEVEPLPAPVVGAPESKKLLIDDLTDRTCKWPGEEDKPPYTYCAHDAVEGRPYCPFHEKLSRGNGTPSERRAGRMAEAA